MLAVQVFGGLAVERDGAQCGGAAARRKTLALLALLAGAGRRGLSRDKLTAYLWPESDTEHGRGLLKQACYALRRDLGTPELFLGSIELRLNPGLISSDVESFEGALDQHDPARAVSLHPPTEIALTVQVEAVEKRPPIEGDRACRVVLVQRAFE